MRPPFRLDLYLVTDRRLCAGRGIERVVAEAAAGGVTMVQLRDDDTPAPELIDLARRLKALLAPLGVPFIVNNRLEVALAAGADGVHVGQSDTPAAEARARLGPTALLGLSITDTAQLASVDSVAVDYLGVGPIFATATKADAAPPMGLGGLAATRARTALPIVAIGGITGANTREVIGTGADGIAVVSAICAASAPEAASRELRALVDGAKATGAGP